MTDWTTRLMALAVHIAQWSKDPRTKVGAVIVDEERRVLSLGYNGFPRHVHDLQERYEERSVKHRLVVHGEANALLNARGSVAGATIYCTKAPRTDCVKLLIQAGVSKVVCPAWDTEGVWAEDAQFARQMLEEAGVRVLHV